MPSVLTRLASSLFAVAAALSAHPVQVHKNIAYINESVVSDKQRLDLYLPADAKDFPVLVFFHGGFWSQGDRSQYTRLGEFFAQHGIGVVIPSYRLAPSHQFPAQANDSAAVVAWTKQHISEYQGDSKRIYLAGHSAGAHLASLLALDDRYLKHEGVAPSTIKGVVSLSAPYLIYGIDSVFGRDPAAWESASPMKYIHAGAPPFLLVFAERDFPTLPEQAQMFHSSLQGAGVSSKLIRIPNEDHVSYLFTLLNEANPTTQAILKFVR